MAQKILKKIVRVLWTILSTFYSIKFFCKVHSSREKKTDILIHELRYDSTHCTFLKLQFTFALLLFMIQLNSRKEKNVWKRMIQITFIYKLSQTL